MKMCLFSLLMVATNLIYAQDFALNFNGVNSNVIPDSSKLEIVNSSGVAFNMWLKADWSAKNAYIFDWADSLDYRAGNDNMRFNLRSIKTGVLRFGFYFNQAIPNTVQANVSNFNNEWLLVTCVLNPKNVGAVAAEYLQAIYINGELVDSNTVRISAINTGNNSIHISKGSHFRIGCRHQLDTSSFYLGQMDNFQVHSNITLSSLVKTFKCVKNSRSSNSILFYTMNEGVGATTADSSVSNADGRVEGATWTPSFINPLNKVPILSFTDTTKSPSLGAKFTNTSQFGSTYKWTFSDGDSSTNTSVYHAFPYPDTFRVCLDGQNSCGISGAQVCKDVVIVCPYTDAKYTYASTSGNTYSFEALTGEKYEYSWDFGDKSYAISGDNENNQVYTFSDTGTYEVCLAVRSPCGRDTSCKTIEIAPLNRSEYAAIQGFEMYPNPCTGSVCFKTTSAENTRLKIYDAAGALLLSQSIQSEYRSNLSFLPSGVYTVCISDKNNDYYQKLIKQ